VTYPNSQRTPEWIAARMGLITASRFADAMANPETKRYQNYRDELVDQRIGLINFSNYFEKPWFKHGKEMEPRAIAAYAFFAGGLYPDAEIVAMPEFIKHPKYRAGCSPDVALLKAAKVAGGCELKCRADATAYWKAINGPIESVYKPQVQGAMWVTGLDWWHYGNYCEDERLTIEKRFHVEPIKRDDAYIARIEEAVLRLDAEVETMSQEILEALA